MATRIFEGIKFFQKILNRTLQEYFCEISSKSDSFREEDLNGQLAMTKACWTMASGARNANHKFKMATFPLLIVRFCSKSIGFKLLMI